MKKLIFIGLSFFMILKLSGQTQGINYQAVIIDKTPQEIPGRDITGNIMPNHPLMIRFSILDAAGTIEYQEEHSTTTDMYGMINLVIGKGTPTAISPDDFTGIDWNGTPKSLKVDLSLGVTEVFYTDFSLEELTFIPYAFHKNITATGSLMVDGKTSLKSRVDVTDGSPTFLSGDLNVEEQTILQNNLTVNAPSNLKGQVTINPDFAVPGLKSDYGAYPLRVEGANQGIAVKIDGTRNSNNYFVTFWDDVNIQGRIEGQTVDELINDPEYIFENILLGNEVIGSTIDVGKAVAGVVAASSSSTVCAGFGACVTAPVPSLIVAAAAEVVIETANLAMAVTEQVLYNISRQENIGVTYQSGAGDYAEWLPKSASTEKFSPGDIVGVKGGFISRTTDNADHFMVISRNPIVLGNMPEQKKETDYEKVAFMGQVPVKVLGKVQPGDFIIPDGNNNGTGKAVSSENIEPDQYHKIVGVAWSGSDQFGYVNTVVGLNSNLMGQVGARQEQKIREQEAEISSLKKQIDQMNNVLALAIPNYSDMMNNSQQTVKSSTAQMPDQNFPREERTVVYHEVTRGEILEGINMARKILKDKGVDLEKHPFFAKMDAEPDYKECFVNDALTSFKNEMDKFYLEDIKSGARVIKVQ